MLKYMTLFLLIHQMYCSETTQLFKEVYDYHNDTYKKAEYAFEVVQIMYNSFRQWFFTITFCEFTYFENRILKYTENYGNGYNVMLINSCPYANQTIVKPKINNHGETAYLVTSNDLDIEISEWVINALKRTGVFKPRSAVIFVVNTPIESGKYFYYMLKNHFQLLWSRSITNSVLILKSDNNLKMFTYNPFLQQVKDITGVKDVSHLLAKQYHNLHGYRLRLSVFRKVFISDETGPVLCDSNLAKTVISFLNATCQPLAPRDDSTVGDLLDNGTATGITADLMDEYSDLELNSRILKNTYYGYIDTTYPLVQDELCFVVKKSEIQSTFNTTMQLVSRDMLMLFLFTSIIFIVITISVRKIETKILNIDDKQTTGSTVMDLIRCLIRQTADFKFIGPMFRCLILLIITYSLIVDVAIDGIITTAITYPRYKPDISSLSDLANSNLTLGIHNRDIKIVNNSFTPDIYAKIYNRIELFNDHKIKDAFDERKFEYATLIKKTDGQYVTSRPGNMKNGKPLFYVMPDCPLPCFIVYGLRYGSPYLPRIDYILKQLTRGGIIQYWDRTEERSKHNKLFSNESKEKKPLNIINLQEMFYVLLIGEAVSTFVFIMEILLYKLRMRN